MTPGGTALFAGLGSLALLAGAFAFQHIGGLAPCSMCIWQRYPHGVAGALGLLAVLAPVAGVLLLGMLSALTTAGIGLYHVGVEQGVLPGPNACAGGGIATFEEIMATEPVLCDEVAWSLAGVSMAGWNVLFSLGLAVIWGIALRLRYASSSASQ